MALHQARLTQAQPAAGQRAAFPGESTFARMLEADPAQDAKLKESCIQMESLLLKQMLTVMRKSVEKTGLIDGGHAEEIFTDMLYDKYAEEMSRSQTLGLSRTIYSQLTGGKKWA
jgi:Rod binding domain-containing protein